MSVRIRPAAAAPKYWSYSAVPREVPTHQIMKALGSEYRFVERMLNIGMIVVMGLGSAPPPAMPARIMRISQDREAREFIPKDTCTRAVTDVVMVHVGWKKSTMYPGKFYRFNGQEALEILECMGFDMATVVCVFGLTHYRECLGELTAVNTGMFYVQVATTEAAVECLGKWDACWLDAVEGYVHVHQLCKEPLRTDTVPKASVITIDRTTYKRQHAPEPEALASHVPRAHRAVGHGYHIAVPRPVVKTVRAGPNPGAVAVSVQKEMKAATALKTKAPARKVDGDEPKMTEPEMTAQQAGNTAEKKKKKKNKDENGTAPPPVATKQADAKSKQGRGKRRKGAKAGSEPREAVDAATPRGTDTKVLPKAPTPSPKAAQEAEPVGDRAVPTKASEECAAPAKNTEPWDWCADIEADEAQRDAEQALEDAGEPPVEEQEHAAPPPSSPPPVRPVFRWDGASSTPPTSRASTLERSPVKAEQDAFFDDFGVKTAKTAHAARKDAEPKPERQRHAWTGAMGPDDVELTRSRSEEVVQERLEEERAARREQSAGASKKATTPPPHPRVPTPEAMPGMWMSGMPPGMPPLQNPFHHPSIQETAWQMFGAYTAWYAAGMAGAMPNLAGYGCNMGGMEGYGAGAPPPPHHTAYAEPEVVEVDESDVTSRGAVQTPTPSPDRPVPQSMTIATQTSVADDGPLPTTPPLLEPAASAEAPLREERTLSASAEVPSGGSGATPVLTQSCPALTYAAAQLDHAALPARRLQVDIAPGSYLAYNPDASFPTPLREFSGSEIDFESDESADDLVEFFSPPQPPPQTGDLQALCSSTAAKTLPEDAAEWWAVSPRCFAATFSSGVPVSIPPPLVAPERA
eukprot:TRINITY_DN1777_c0_g2_i1.p1 TRINITY_DN1777_c0_g2~~TRINITY_DN1777_c0_g2_i1.p1  ORF type:complete len:862 (+),score=268.21 TRINITY_DN1777_c0_g2_i1:63-2648(+)